MSLSAEEKGRQLRTSRNFLHQRPHPLLINLTHTRHEPDQYTSIIKLDDNTTWDYSIQVINIQKYTFEEIEKYKFDLLLPFLPLTIWKKSKHHPEPEKTVTTLTELLQRSRHILDNRNATSYTTPAAAKELWRSLLEVCAFLFENQKDILKEVQLNMGSRYYFWDEKLEMANARISVLEKTNQNLLAENDNLHLKYVGLQSENSNLQSENNSLQSENNNLQTQNAELLEALKNSQKHSFSGFIKFILNWKHFSIF